MISAAVLDGLREHFDAASMALTRGGTRYGMVHPRLPRRPGAEVSFLLHATEAHVPPGQPVSTGRSAGWWWEADGTPLRGPDGLPLGPDVDPDVVVAAVAAQATGGEAGA